MVKKYFCLLNFNLTFINEKYVEKEKIDEPKFIPQNKVEIKEDKDKEIVKELSKENTEYVKLKEKIADLEENSASSKKRHIENISALKAEISSLKKEHAAKTDQNLRETQNKINELTERIKARYEELIIPIVKSGACGCVYTQLSDVEDEINGFYTYDRKVCKVVKEDMLAMSEKLYAQLEN